jgi:hypothetical protein
MGAEELSLSSPRHRKASVDDKQRRQGASMHRLAVLGLAACAFIAAYILLVGALVYANFAVFSPGRRFGYWTGTLILYSPAAAAALLAAWYSRLSPRGASALLGVFLTLICAVVQWTLLQRTGSGSLLISELVILSVVFIATGLICHARLTGAAAGHPP